MQFKRISKSLRASAIKCPWYAHARQNLGHKPPSNTLGRLGSETHLAWAEYHNKSKPLDQIRSELSQEAAALFNMALASDTMKLFDVVCEFKIEMELDGAKLIAILDRLGYTSPRQLVVEELKTEYNVKDDRFERNFYVYMADRAFPSNRIIFTRLYARSGQRTIYTYERVDGPSFTVTHPDGATETIDLEAEVRSVILMLTDLEPIPAVGPQCKDWYGEPCPFYQNLCPATAMAVETVNAVTQSTSGAEAAAAKALLNADDPLSLPADTVGAALNGINKLKDGCKTVEKIIKSWSERNGAVVTADGVYSWQDIETPEIDNYAALLNMLLRHVPIEDIAKAVNVSQTSLKKLPGKYGAIAEEIASAATSMRTTRRFQRQN